MTDPYLPLQGHLPLQGKQDRQYPPTVKISYNNYLVGVSDRDHCEYNFVFSESGASQFPEKNKKLTETKI